MIKKIFKIFLFLLADVIIFGMLIMAAYVVSGNRYERSNKNDTAISQEYEDITEAVTVK